MLLNHDTGLIDTIQTLDTTVVPPVGGGVAGQLQITGTGGLVTPIGTTAQRPASPINGTARYNTTISAFEFYQNNTWSTFSAGSVSSVAVAGGTGISSAGGPITTAGTITLTLGVELQGLSALSANGLVARTTTGTYASRTVTGTAANIVVTDGNGVSGNPTINLATAGSAVTSFFGQFTTDAFGRVTATAAATAGNITTALGYTPVNRAGDTLTGVINFGGFTATNLGAPSAGSDAATKNYVDAATSGLSWKTAVRASTTANGTLASAFANGSSIDGVTLVTGDRILLKNQTAASENGIYIVQATGAPVRADDMNVSAEFPNATVYVSQGTTLADTGWTQTVDNVVVGTTGVVFSQFSGSGAYTAGTGLTLTGNTFSITAPIATTLGGTGLTTIGSANQIFGVNTAGTGTEYKTVTAGTSIGVVNAAGSITINNTGVTSILAGGGISVSGATGAVTVSNTGVTSVGVSTTSAALAVGSSPVTTTGTITVNAQADINALASFNTGTGIAVRTAANTWALRTDTGTSNQIVVTNGDGVAGNPTFALASNAVLPGTGSLTVVSGTTGQQPAASDGQLRYNLTTNRLEWANDTTWANVGSGDGTVTSVALTVPSIMSVSGSPVTTAGTIAVSLATQTTNTVFAAPNGSTGTPTFRSLAYADLPYRLIAENPVSPVAPTATGDNASAEGSGANAPLTGQNAVASGRFTANGDAQQSTYVLRNITSNATSTQLFLDGVAARMVVPNNSAWTFDILVVGRRTDAVGGAAGYKISGICRKDGTAGSMTFVGVPSRQILGETVASLDAVVSADTTNGSLNVSVSGIAAQTWRWVATVTTAEVAN